MGHEVICSDLTTPEKNAAASHASVASKIRYEEIDATRIPYRNYFDIIVFKSILGGIARHEKDGVKEVVLREIHEALKPHGQLLFAENLNASPIHRLLRRKMTPWGNYWNYLRIEEVSHLFKPYSSLAVGSAGFLGAFGRSEQQRSWLALMDSFLFDRMLPSSMHYILFGVATK
jgi:SAM-dependent methyltransferase